MSWVSKSSWHIVADKNSTVQPELERLVAKRMDAAVFEIHGSRVLKVAKPDLVLDVIRKAANAVQRLRQRKVHRTSFGEPKRNLSDAKGEAPLQTSADFVRTYGAIVDALTATIMNAEAGLNWLSAQPADLEAVRRTLIAIADDGKRAGEIVIRLLPPINRSPQRDDALDP